MNTGPVTVDEYNRLRGEVLNRHERRKEAKLLKLRKSNNGKSAQEDCGSKRSNRKRS